MDDAQRPQPETTYRLYGHEAAEAVLARAWRSGRLAHGWLLTGAEGIGKATLAFRFARALLAGAMAADPADPPALLPGLAGPDPAADPGPDRLPDIGPDDAAARLIAGGAHPGLRVVRRATNPDTGRLRSEIVIDDVRAATGFLTRTAMDGGWRIVIVDPVEELNRNAANALLKSLEEPPDKCLFLLINHVSGQVLPTIRSRCQSLALQPLGPEDFRAAIADWPADAATADGLPAALAEGSPGRALRLIEADAGGLDSRIGTILDAPEDRSTMAALDLAEQVARAGATLAFETVGELLARRAAALARAAPQPAAREAAAALWFEIGARFREAEQLNLDRRHTVLRACRDMRGLARPPAAASGA